MSEATYNVGTGQLAIVRTGHSTKAVKRRLAKAAAKAARLGDPGRRTAREVATQQWAPGAVPNRKTRRAYGLR